MENIRQLLSREQCEYIYKNALETLSKVGVYCENKQTVDELSAKTSIKYDNKRIFFDAAKVSDFFQWPKNKVSPASVPGFSVSNHWNAHALCDPAANKPRPASEQEAIDMAKLSDSLGSKDVPIPVSPGNIPPQLNTLACEKIALTHTKNLGGCLTATDDYEIESLVQMYQIAKRRYLLAIEPLISPLRLNSANMDMYFKYRHRNDFDITIFAAIPMAGATAPLALPACLIMALAESLALDYIFGTLSDNKHRMFIYRLEPFDLHSGNIVFGSPEWILFKQAINEVLFYLTGEIPRGGSFRTTAKNVDGQAIAQVTAAFIWQTAMGARHFGAMGQMCNDQVWSPVLAMFEKELLGFGERLCQGLNNCWLDEDPIGAITGGLTENNFLTEDGTLNVMRNMYWTGKLFSNESLNTWLGNGARDANQKAWDEAQKIIKQNDFILDENQREEIELAYKKAAARYK